MRAEQEVRDKLALYEKLEMQEYNLLKEGNPVLFAHYRDVVCVLRWVLDDLPFEIK